MEHASSYLKKFQCLNGFTLKMIAIITMLIDHIGATFVPMQELRIIGRIAFPIFCFLIVEGYMHTSNLKKYFLRLLAFAFISEIPFDMAFKRTYFDFGYQNVFFTLCLGLMALYCIEKARENRWYVLGILAALCLADLFMVDYGSGGVLIICIFYILKEKPILLTFALIMIFCFGYYGSIEMYALLALPFIGLYNHKRGPQVKYLFYVFYPVHLLILGLLVKFMY